jgi:hypothetical protein
MDVLHTLKELNYFLEASNQELVYNVLSLLLAFAALRYRKNDNKLFIIGVILAPTMIDTLYLDDYLFSKNIPFYATFLFYSLFDFCVLLLLLYRENVVRIFVMFSFKLRSFNGNKLSKKEFIYYRHINEYKIIVIFAISIVINILVSAEYPARLYINKNILYGYYLYTPIKLLLNVVLVYLVFNLGSTQSILRSR